MLGPSDAVRQWFEDFIDFFFFNGNDYFFYSLVALCSIVASLDVKVGI